MIMQSGGECAEHCAGDQESIAGVFQYLSSDRGDPQGPPQISSGVGLLPYGVAQDQPTMCQPVEPFCSASAIIALVSFFALPFCLNV